MKNIINPRQLAVITLVQLEEKEDFLREVLALHLNESSLSSVDQGLYTELVYGTTRMRKNLDYIIGLFSKRPLTKLKSAVLNNLRLGAYQILYLDRIPPSAAVNEAVKLAHLYEHRGTANFTNAILRQIVRNKAQIRYPALEKDPISHIALKYSLPKWIVELWLELWGTEETVALCQTINQPPELNIRVNTLRIAKSKLSSLLKEEGITVEEGGFAPDVLKVMPASKVLQKHLLDQGLFYIQDESSVLVGHALQVEAGQLVYDLCSAPGGKTTHLAQLMEDKGKIIAFDVSEERLMKVRENCGRLGITCVETRQANAAEPLELPPAPRVLVDAPCSGLGTMGRRPDIKWRKTPQDIAELVPLQRKILAEAASYVKKGGILAYSTCTLIKGENQDVANWFLASHPEFRPLSLPEWFPQSANEPGWYRTFLPHRHRLDGFFLALFTRV